MTTAAGTAACEAVANLKRVYAEISRSYAGISGNGGLDVAFFQQWVKFLGIAPLKPGASSVPADSVLGQWRVAAADQVGLDNLTTRQMVERHVSDASCATCHTRIDPYGFGFENFDTIGRFRTEEAPGRPVDTHSKLRDGTEFTRLDGLREYLLAKKQPEFVRLFCQRLLGYALGRSTTLSDTAAIDKMAAAVRADDGRVFGAIGTTLESPQFLMVRGKDAESID